jgi:hypothetical protein
MHYKKFIRQWKHVDAQLFVARQLAQSGKQDKTFIRYSLARHDIHLPVMIFTSLTPDKWASIKLHLWIGAWQISVRHPWKN